VGEKKSLLIFAKVGEEFQKFKKGRGGLKEQRSGAFRKAALLHLSGVSWGGGGGGVGVGFLGVGSFSIRNSVLKLKRRMGEQSVDAKGNSHFYSIWDIRKEEAYRKESEEGNKKEKEDTSME